MSGIPGYVLKDQRSNKSNESAPSEVIMNGCRPTILCIGLCSILLGCEPYAPREGNSSAESLAGQQHRSSAGPATSADRTPASIRTLAPGKEPRSPCRTAPDSAKGLIVLAQTTATPQRDATAAVAAPKPAKDAAALAKNAAETEAAWKVIGLTLEEMELRSRALGEADPQKRGEIEARCAEARAKRHSTFPKEPVP
jgi:hypothetical protein